MIPTSYQIQRKRKRKEKQSKRTLYLTLDCTDSTTLVQLKQTPKVIQFSSLTSDHAVVNQTDSVIKRQKKHSLITIINQ